MKVRVQFNRIVKVCPSPCRPTNWVLLKFGLHPQMRLRKYLPVRKYLSARKVHPISNEPPFPNFGFGKGGSFEIGWTQHLLSQTQTPQLPPFLGGSCGCSCSCSCSCLNTTQQRFAKIRALQQRESKCRTNKNCDKEKKVKNEYEPYKGSWSCRFWF